MSFHFDIIRVIQTMLPNRIKYLSLFIDDIFIDYLEYIYIYCCYN